MPKRVIHPPGSKCILFRYPDILPMLRSDFDVSLKRLLSCFVDTSLDHLKVTVFASVHLLQRSCRGSQLQLPCGGSQLQRPCGGSQLQRPCGGESAIAALRGSQLQRPCGGNQLQRPCGGSQLQEPCGGSQL